VRPTVQYYYYKILKQKIDCITESLASRLNVKSRLNIDQD